MKTVKVLMVCALILGFISPTIVLASGEKANELVVVSDTRVIPDTGYYNTFVKYLADAYNSNIMVFAIWCTVLTTLFGAFLGFSMDFLMSRTGLDLKSRKIIEH